jgi:anti-anti-sigma regulatory factor
VREQEPVVDERGDLVRWHMTSLDSSGLSALLRARAFLAREDRPLVLVCPPGPARRVLDLASVLDTFVTYPSAEAAVAALVPADD